MIVAYLVLNNLWLQARCCIFGNWHNDSYLKMVNFEFSKSIFYFKNRLSRHLSDWPLMEVFDTDYARKKFLIQNGEKLSLELIFILLHTQVLVKETLFMLKIHTKPSRISRKHLVCIKVNKFQKQIILFSILPKTERKPSILGFYLLG